MSRYWRLVLPAVLGGLLIGVWIGSRVERAAMRRMRHEGPTPERILKMLRREIGLRADQAESVSKVLEAKRPEFQAMHREEIARMNALRDSIDKDISSLLDDGQKKKLEALRARWDKREKEHGPPNAP